MEPQPGDLPQGLEIFMNILVFSIPFLVLLVAYVAGKMPRNAITPASTNGKDTGSASRPSRASTCPTCLPSPPRKWSSAAW